MQANEKKLDRDATLENIKSEPTGMPVVKKEKLAVSVASSSSNDIIILESDDEDNPVNSGESPKVKQKQKETITTPKKVGDESDGKVNTYKPGPASRKRKVAAKEQNEGSSTSKGALKQPDNNRDESVKNMKIRLASKKSKPLPSNETTEQADSKPAEMSSFVKEKFSSFAEKLLCVRKNFKSMTENQMIKTFYGLSCSQCEMELDFDDFASLAEHQRVEHNKERFMIDCCNVKVPRSQLVCHIKHHLGMEKTSLKQHIVQLSTQFFCDFCPKVFSKEHMMVFHMKFDHTNDENDDGFDLEEEKKPKLLLTCDLCHRTFEQKYLLEKHIRCKHLNETAFSCLYCGEVVKFV